MQAHVVAHVPAPVPGDVMGGLLSPGLAAIGRGEGKCIRLGADSEGIIRLICILASGHLDLARGLSFDEVGQRPGIGAVIGRRGGDFVPSAPAIGGIVQVHRTGNVAAGLPGDGLVGLFGPGLAAVGGGQSETDGHVHVPARIGAVAGLVVGYDLQASRAAHARKADVGLIGAFGELVYRDAVQEDLHPGYSSVVGDPGLEGQGAEVGCAFLGSDDLDLRREDVEEVAAE